MSSRKLRNDGFGPQLSGKQTIAEIFDSEQSMHYTTEDMRQQILLEAVDPELVKEIKKFKTKVCKNTLGS